MTEDQECLDCGFVFEPQTIIHDSIYDTHCPRCGTQLVLNETEEEREDRRHREQFREDLNDRLEKIAQKASEPDYVYFHYSLEELRSKLEEEHQRIVRELERRSD